MKNVVGSPARGTSFFPREREVQKIIDRLKDGNNLQIAAPRRVGKTSILFHLLDEKINGFTYIYIDSERVDNEQGFYKKILKELLKAEQLESANQLKEIFKKGKQFINKIKSINILGTGFELVENKSDVNYYEDLTYLLSAFESVTQQKFILLIDEFPQTILNIVAANDGHIREAVRFLQSNRELRLNPEINKRVQFIYTGSVGLNHTVASINASVFVNDLNTVEIEPITNQEARRLIHSLLQEKSIIIDEPALEHLLEQIEWLIPFHIQLAVQELINLTNTSKKADVDSVNDSFANIVKSRNKSHFEHYYSRLKSQFKNQAYKYADDLLQQMALERQLTRNHIQDLAIKYQQEENWKQIIEILVYDGYINNNSDKNLYQFNSPVLRMWWEQCICK